MDALIGKQVGHYVIRERIGAGGMAVVYRAEQPSLGRDVAVKVMTGPLASDEEFVKRFRREAMAAGGLGHPNILTVYDAGSTPEDVHYIAMEYAPGGTLRDMLGRGPLLTERAVVIAAQVADALHAAHRHGIVHRDLKPSNILISRDGRPLLMDFGVAQVGGGTRLTRTGVTVGTPEYMSPEQAQGLVVDERSDIYALGVMLFEMLTGDVPYSGETPLATLYRQVHDPVPQLNAMKGDLPTWLASIVETALAKSPDERYGNAAEMAAALRAGSQGAPVVAARRAAEKATLHSPVPAYPAPPPPPPLPPGSGVAAQAPGRKGGAGIWLFIGLLAVALVAGGTYALFFLGVGEGFGIGLPSSVPRTETIVPTVVVAAVDGAGEEAAVTATAVAAILETTEAKETAFAQREAEATLGAANITATAVAELLATAEAVETGVAAEAAASTATAEASARETSEAALAQQTTPTDTPRPVVTPTPTSSPTPTETITLEPTREPVQPPATVASHEICGWEKGETWKRGDQPHGTLTASREQVRSGSYSGKLSYDFPTADNDFVVFLYRHALPGQPKYLRMWVYGDGSGHFLNAWIRDAGGQIWQSTFGQVSHRGWAQMEASLLPGQDWPWAHISGPDNGRVDYPIEFWGLVLDDVPDTFIGKGTIYLDDLQGEPQAGSSQPPATTPAAVTTVTTPSSPLATLSGKIAFPVINRQHGKYDIHVALADGSQRWVVAQRARQPAFRSDGKLVMNGDGGGRDNLWMMNADGGDARQVSRHPEDSRPSWSSDGGRLVFDSLLGRDKSAPRIYVHDDLAARNEPRMLMFGSYEVRGRVSIWLSDGRIVFNGCDYWAGGGSCGLYAISDAGGQPTRLTSHSSDSSANARGTKIVFMSKRDGSWEVYVMNWDGSGQTNLTRSPNNDGLPAWSPDGQWIAFVSDRSGVWAMWAMRADGSNPRELFPLNGGFGNGDYHWSMERISWAP